MKKIALLSLFLLSGCLGSGVEPLYVKDGVQVYRATCNGLVRDIGDCYAHASTQCAGQFEVINTLEDKNATVYNKFGSTNTDYHKGSKSTFDADTGMKSSVVNRSMFFYCK